MADPLHNQRVPDAVRHAFDAVLAFQLPNPENAAFRERIHTDAERESRSTTALLLNEKSLTGGILSACVDPVLVVLDEFKKQCGAFDTAIRPHLPKIDAINDIDRQIAEKQRESDQTQIRTEEKHAADHHYAQAKEKQNRLKEAYESMSRAEGQREAKDFPPILYFTILIIIGAVEWMINYSSFLEFFSVPAMAAGFTFAVALAVACASHWHGTRLQGKGHYFGDHVELGEKKKEILAITIATAALIVAISYVGWIRYSWAIDLVSQLGVNSGISIGQNNNLPTINVGQKVILSLAANLLVWFIGAALAYAVHDKNPAFTEKFREFKAANKHYLALRVKVDAEIHRLRALLEKDIAELKNTAQAKEQEARPLADMLTTKEESVSKINAEADRLANRLIRNYRTTLGDIAAVDNPALKFNQGGKIIDLESYRQIDINHSLQTTSEQ
jgi:hypothetical protein